MTILAEFVCTGTPEIGLLVALPAGQFSMFSGQSKSRNAVIESFAKTVSFEAAGVVALFAPRAGFWSLECTPVSIRVTIAATAEKQSLEDARSGTFVRSYTLLPCHNGFYPPMAFLTWNLLVPSGEGKQCTGMAEF
jgi:hypothetical protein